MEPLDRHWLSSSKLWTVANYLPRNVWEEAGDIPDHKELKDELKGHSKYKGLPSQSSQHVLEEFAEVFNSGTAPTMTGITRPATANAPTTTMTATGSTKNTLDQR